jgi:purine-binding chemotaxis protein CheW
MPAPRRIDLVADAVRTRGAYLELTRENAVQIESLASDAPISDRRQSSPVDSPVAEAVLPKQVISFAIGNEQYGVDIMAVREIKGWSEVTPLPGQPDYVRGVLNLRGSIVPIIDLRCRFGQAPTEATPLHIAIIVQIATKPVGLLADRVLDIVTFESSQVQPVPRIASDARLHFIAGLVTIEGTMIALIDLRALLPEDIEH